MNNVMLIGRDSHYYVRGGGLSQDYKTAFEEALDLAVEQIANEMGLGESTSDSPGSNTRSDHRTGSYINAGNNPAFTNHKH